jgi:four helix bundle protein
VATIEKFEDLTCWQKARELNRLVYKISRNGNFAKDFGRRDQIRRASVSVMSNIAEGFERGGDKEFVQFLSNAKGSSGEVRCQLYAALDESYLNDAEFDELYQRSEEVSRMISGFMTYFICNAQTCAAANTKRTLAHEDFGLWTQGFGPTR